MDIYEAIILTLLALSVISDAMKAGGWEPDRLDKEVYFICALLTMFLLIVGVMKWL